MTESRQQPDYAALKRDFDQGLIDEDDLARALSTGWAANYLSDGAAAELVEVNQEKLTYMFDIAAQRVIGVHGRTVPTSSQRPTSRMRGFPLPPNRSDVIRGHLAAHTLGGGTDINLIPQNASLNISRQWRRLERLAQSNPGCFIAVEATYDNEPQTPAELTYLVAANGTLMFERFKNA